MRNIKLIQTLRASMPLLFIEPSPTSVVSKLNLDESRELRNRSCPTTAWNVVRGASSPENPALMTPDPLSKMIACGFAAIYTKKYLKRIDLKEQKTL